MGKRRGNYRKRQRGGKFDVQKLLAKTGMEFHWPGYQYMGPGTHLAKRLKRGDPGINRLDLLPRPTISIITKPDLSRTSIKRIAR